MGTTIADLIPTLNALVLEQRQTNQLLAHVSTQLAYVSKQLNEIKTAVESN